jgi:hypothetical protein
VFCVLTDEGYSNWTVENTIATCLQNANPHFPSDRFYGKSPELLFAEQCPHFIEGDPVKIDVDREEQGADGDMSAYSAHPVVKLLLMLEGEKS